MPKSQTRGDRIRIALQATTMTQVSLAQRLGITKQNMGDIVNGRLPGDKHIVMIAECLAVPEHWLVHGGPLPPGLQKRMGNDTSSGSLPRGVREESASKIDHGKKDAWLPLDSFALVRGGLRLIRAEREIFGGTTRDVHKALVQVWEHQLSFPWSPAMRERLEQDRDADLRERSSPTVSETVAEDNSRVTVENVEASVGAHQAKRIDRLSINDPKPPPPEESQDALPADVDDITAEHREDR